MPSTDQRFRHVAVRSRSSAALVGALLALAAAAPPAAAEAPAAWPAGMHASLRFDRLNPLAAKWEFARRVLLPTVDDRLRRFEQASGVVAVEQTIDLADENFDLYVPREPPVDGYGLIVFVAPMERFPLPPDWKREFDRRGYLFVAAQRSGNDANVLERRIPLALHAYETLHARYRIDPRRRFVAGFSGGSRVAQRIAFAYPDLFDGALLFASSDPLGEPGAAPPLPELMDRVRRHSRFVFGTGGQDLPNRKRDARTRESFDTYCLYQYGTLSMPRLGHWVPAQRELRKALDMLEAPPQPAPVAIEQCIERMDAAVTAQLEAIEALLERGDSVAAGAALGELEERYGGLAAPRSVTLARRIAAQLPAADGR